MATKKIPVSSSSIRFKRDKDDKYFLAGATDWIIGGYNLGTYFSFLKTVFSTGDWADVIEITKAELVLVTPAGAGSAITGVKPTNNAKCQLIALSGGPFADNTSGTFATSWTGDITPARSTLARTGVVDDNQDHENRIDVRELVKYWAPTRVKVNIGGKSYKGLNKANYGVLISATSGEFVVASERHSDVTVQPRIELTYTAVPAPGYNALTGPPPIITQLEDEFFEADYVPGRAGDVITAYQIQVYLNSQATIDDSGSKATWSFNGAASASETETNHFRRALPVLLKSGTDYKWRARSKNQRGEWTAWTGLVALRISTDNPALSALLPDGSRTYETLNNVVFEALYSDPNVPPNPLLRYRVQLAASRANNAWDLADDLLWDTQDRAATATERATSRIRLPYGGDGLPAGTYSWRIMATDDLGGQSAWAYPAHDLVITVGEQPDPGEADLLTGYLNRRTKARVVIRKMGANRGPGPVVAIIEDAANVGGSEFHNSPGEFFFTLPAIHPQVSVIEPWLVHYALEVYQGQGWTEKAAGLIVDFDATDNDVVFYGMDYLGILDMDVDDRFNPSSGASADTPAGLYPAAAGGSKYNQITISAIVQDQIDRAIHHTDSPVGFIGRGSIATMNEKITIFSTFKTRLSFIAGLIDSHRGANLGLRTRIRTRKTTAAGYQFVVEDNPGKDRDNIRLSYGEFIQGFRVVPFGDWGTRVFAIGRALNSSKVEYYPNILGTVSEAFYGRIPKVNLWQDITDKSDLQRRAQLYARQVSKIGKRMALAIRVDSIGIKDGWDICDSILVDIDRGVVNTLNYGSGYWTIWGWSWQLYPDGHTDLTLSISPRLDAEPPGLNYTIKTISKANPTQVTTTTPHGLHTGDQVVISGSNSTPKIDGLRTVTVIDADTFTVPVNVTTAGTAGYVNVAGLIDSDPISTGSEWVVAAGGPPADSGPATTWVDSITGTVWQYDPNTGAWVDKTATLPGVPRMLARLSIMTADIIDSQVTNAKMADDSVGTDELIDGSITIDKLAPGTIPGSDSTPPPVPVVKAVSSNNVQQEDGTPATVIVATVGYAPPSPAGLSDLAEYVLQSTRFTLPADPTQPDWTLATQWMAVSPDVTGTLDLQIVQPSVLAATKYWVRVLAVDDSGNRSVYSAAMTIQTAADTDAPPQPAGLALTPGMGVFGIRWNDIDALDLAYVEVQWRVASPAGNWVSGRVFGTLLVVTGVTNNVLYDVRARSVDLSNNTLDTTLGTVKVDDNPEAGWVSAGQVTPVPVAGDTLVWTSAMIQNVLAGQINADWISAGTLRVGGAAGNAAAITVYDSLGRLIGRWSTNGIEVFDPTKPAYKMLIDANGLTVFDLTDPANPIKTVSLTPIGIDAASITFGSARGGHNLIQNSSFELGRFGTTAIVVSTWDLAADWNAGRQGADTNITVGASALTVTTI